jgi:hypothetical protein
MSEVAGIKVELTQNLKHLHLPTIRECYEEVARQAERETLSYERYLHEVVQRECDERLENRTAKMLRESHLPLEKSLEMFDVRRCPLKQPGKCGCCWMVVFWNVQKTFWYSAIPEAARRTCFRRLARN